MPAAKFPTTLGDDPASNAAAVAPSDANDLATAARALYVGGAGDVVVDTQGGQTSVKFSAVPAGTVLPVIVTRVRATGTTATLLVALW
jgi:hypothetical protein